MTSNDQPDAVLISWAEMSARGLRYPTREQVVEMMREQVRQGRLCLDAGDTYGAMLALEALIALTHEVESWATS